MARGLGYAAQTRKLVLKRRKKVQAGQGRIKAAPKPRRDPKKTPLMLLIESEHGQSIEELVSSGEIADVGRTLDIDPSTVSKWRLRFGIR